MERGHQLGPQAVRGLVPDERHCCRGRQLGAKMQLGHECGVAQHRADDPGPGEEAYIPVGQGRQRGSVTVQIIGRPAVGEQQAENLPIDLALARPLSLGCSRRGQHPVRLGEIGAVPDPQGLRDADDFAKTGSRPERRRIEIGRNDVAPGCSRIRAIAIGTRRGRDHLAEFLDDAGCAAARRMAKLFDLGGERAGAAFPEAAIYDAGDPARDG